MYGEEHNSDKHIKFLYIAVSAGDFSPGAVYWTREIQKLLFNQVHLARGTRTKLVKLYNELARAPGLDGEVAE